MIKYYACTTNSEVSLNFMMKKILEKRMNKFEISEKWDFPLNVKQT